MNAQKNWSDRADRDLFFTILQVKNIGVISGNEWASIGNAMRILGYGFTNEGCRQHFQGLRRQQLKSESSSPPETAKRPDPALNPITRRPGPGRGRPKKSQPSQLNVGGGGDGASESPSTPASDDFVSPTMAAGVHHSISSPVPPQHINPQLPIDTELTASLTQHMPTMHVNGGTSHHQASVQHAHPHHHHHVHPQVPRHLHAVSRVQPAVVDIHHATAPRLHHPRPTDDDSDDRHSLKRPKMESELDDETVLALAAGSEPGALDHYQFSAYPDP